MKKIISAALAAAATLSVSAVAFAANDPGESPVIEVKEVTNVEVASGAKAEEVLAALAEKMPELKEVKVEDVSVMTFESKTTPYAIMVGGKALAKVDDEDAPAARAEADWSVGITNVSGGDVAKFEVEGPADLVFDSITVTYEAAPTAPAPSNSSTSNPATGIALAVAPAALAAAFVGVAAVVSKKKKG